jgi:hypothetical protein
VAERYLALHEKYLRDGERLLAEGDYVQASEKMWGAVATMVKAVSEERGWRHYRHADLGRAVGNIALATGDQEYVLLFGFAEQLHANFYDNFLSGQAVEEAARKMRDLIQRLVSFRGGLGEAR